TGATRWASESAGRAAVSGTRRTSGGGWTCRLGTAADSTGTVVAASGLLGHTPRISVAIVGAQTQAARRRRGRTPARDRDGAVPFGCHHGLTRSAPPSAFGALGLRFEPEQVLIPSGSRRGGARHDSAGRKPGDHRSSPGWRDR